MAQNGSGQKAFFQIELPSPSKVVSVTVYNRADCCQERMIGYKIILKDKDNNVLFTSNTLSKEAKQIIRTGPTGPVTGSIKYVRLDGGADWINLSQLVVKNKDGVNIAKGAKTTSSGVGFDGAEANAVDGEEASRGHPKEYHSSTQQAFFQIELPNPDKVSSVTVYNRADCCQERMAGYRVTLIDENFNIVFKSIPLTKDAKQIIQVAPTGPVTGSVKFIKLDGGSDYINLSQLVVTNKNGKNVAKGAKTISSGVGFDGAEANAVDGEEASRGHPKEYHSSGLNAFFQIELPNPEIVSSVTVYNRADCCQQRMAGYKIILIDENNNIVFTSDALTKETKQIITVKKIDSAPEQPAATQSTPATDSSSNIIIFAGIVFVICIGVIIFIMTSKKNNKSDISTDE